MCPCFAPHLVGHVHPSGDHGVADALDPAGNHRKREHEHRHELHVLRKRNERVVPHLIGEQQREPLRGAAADRAVKGSSSSSREPLRRAAAERESR